MTEEDSETDMCPVRIMYDHTLKAIWALPVESKGVVDYVVKWCVETLDNAGYTKSRITIKSGQEPAMLALKKAAAAARIGDTALISSPIRESKANGAVQRSIRTWQGQLRTLKCYFERCLGIKLPVDLPLFGWLCVYSSEHW